MNQIFSCGLMQLPLIQMVVGGLREKIIFERIYGQWN